MLVTSELYWAVTLCKTCFYFDIQSTETTSSSAMELEGLKRCQAYMSRNNVQVSELTTDRHISINAYVKREWKDVEHYFDTWHLAKGMFSVKTRNLFFYLYH